MYARKNLDFGLLYLSHIRGALPHIALRASAFISHVAHVLLHWKPQLIMFLFHALSFTSFLSAICSSCRPLCSFLVLTCRLLCLSLSSQAGGTAPGVMLTFLGLNRPAICDRWWAGQEWVDFMSWCHLCHSLDKPLSPLQPVKSTTLVMEEWLRVASHVFNDHYFKQIGYD